ncbi:MAG: hypothetical protein JRI23_08395 [Deltaproteobacteria bacterium]|jgi:hypothetical protein|nr:hypothetical protein [Deltaproteobacteria bacterium]MBW2531633.1 hypothetical protein [Deltaproteobacteria bacterium]
MDRHLDLVEPVLYGDLFDYPLTLDEAHRFCRVPIERAELERALADPEGAGRWVGRVDGYYVMRGREALVTTRRRRSLASERSRRRAKSTMGVLQYLPFLRGSLVTGSAAVDNAEADDDLDYLVLVEPGRLWLVFAMLGTLQRLGLRRRLCVNYYLSLDHLDLRARSAFVARELLQAQSLSGSRDVERLFEANSWIADHYPNAPPPTARPTESGVERRRGPARRMTEAIEGLLGGELGDALEHAARRLLAHRLAAHYRTYGLEVPEEVRQRALAGEELRFHANDYHRNVAARLERRMDELRSRRRDSTEPNRP